MLNNKLKLILKKIKIGVDQTQFEAYLTPTFEARGYSSAGRALHWQCRGRRFDPA